MRKLLLILILTIIFISCNNKGAKTINVTEASEEIIKKEYPAMLSSMFDAHGGIDTWNDMQHLYFEIVGKDNNVKLNTALKSRMAIVNYGSYSVGFDGERAWTSDTTKIKTNSAKYRYDLMLFFYGMPFLMGDDGIKYSEVDPLVFDGVTYPGLMISYNSGVGETPNDQYIVYQDPRTKEMAWLAYAPTSRRNNFSYIKYSEWGITNGLKLPTGYTGFKAENGLPTEKRSETKFVNASFSKVAKDINIFAKPKGAFMETNTTIK